MENYIGQTLGGRYEVREVIGTGGMAIVYKAYCTVLNRYVAIKVLKEEYASDDEFRKRFYNEAQAVAKLSQNNIVSIYDVCQDGDGPEYIVMELCEGVTLKDYLRKKHHLTWQETLFFAQQVARALDHAHSRGIIHQDIKPQNIMLLRDGTAKVMDFGIASFANSQETRKVSSEAIGSVHYISPEQAKGITADFRTDLYSLGVVMYEMLTGTLPFRGDTAVAVIMQHLNTVPPVPSSIVTDIPQAMDEIVMHAMCANVNQRYSSALDMYRDMERLRTNPNLVLNYSGHNNDLDATRAIRYDDQDATQLLRPVDEEQETQYVPRPQQETPAQQQRVYQPVNDVDDEYEQEEPVHEVRHVNTPPKKNHGIKIAVGAVIVVLLAAIAYMASGIFGTKEMVEVPNFISLNYEEDVRNNSEYDAFRFDIETQIDTSGDYEDGEIVDQNPVEGEQVEEGSTITLTVISVDGEMVKVPSVIGQTFEDAQSALRALGLSASQEVQSSETVQAGYVISTDPEPGEEIATGSTVTVIISSGSANTNKTVPDLTGMTQSAAKSLLESMGLQLGEVTQEESDSPEGTVIDQTVAYGTEVAEGTSVGITIAQARSGDGGDGNGDDGSGDDGNGDTGSGDDGNGDDGNSGGSGSTETSVSVTNSAVTVTLPADHKTCQVTISVDGSQLYNHTVREGTQTAVCRLSYSNGVHRIVVTVDGATVYDQDYDFG